MKELELRLATPEDIDLIFAWANDEDERRFSFHPQKIEYADHCKWYEKRMNDEDTVIFIALFDGIEVGQCRLEFENDEALISYFIDKKYRNKGLGKQLIKLISEKTEKNFHKIKRLKAQVKLENLPSQKVFLTMGFKESTLPEYKEYILQI